MRHPRRERGRDLRSAAASLAAERRRTAAASRGDIGSSADPARGAAENAGRPRFGSESSVITSSDGKTKGNCREYRRPVSKAKVARLDCANESEEETPIPRAEITRLTNRRSFRGEAFYLNIRATIIRRQLDNRRRRRRAYFFVTESRGTAGIKVISVAARVARGDSDGPASGTVYFESYRSRCARSVSIRASRSFRNPRAPNSVQSSKLELEQTRSLSIERTRG